MQIFKKIIFSRNIGLKHYSQISSNLNLVKLSNKSLIKLSGKDSFLFLQGLITNDIRFFLSNFDTTIKKCLYSFILQTNGRTLADIFLYNSGNIVEIEYGLKLNEFKGNDNHVTILECDKLLFNNLINLFNMYKFKKQVNINQEKKFVPWILYDHSLNDFDFPEIQTDDLYIIRDPRLKCLGYKILSEETEFQSLKKKLLNLVDKKNVSINESNIDDHILFRYKLGIGEGSIDHPPNKCFPLEDNAGLLNGVNFNKGCYLGQESISRIHYTGVLRKRLMPFEIIDLNDEKNKDKIDFDKNINFGLKLTSQNNLNKRLGKIRNVFKNYGIALLNHKELVHENYFAYNDDLKILIKSFRPAWWPNNLN